jgi:transcriptional regulator with XRE-family HTH domain
MKNSYRELDYTYGKAMQKLRNTIGLTQAGLADRLGVSWRTIAGWEAGSRYPRAEHLKELIALAVQQQAFSVGHEAEEIRTLWEVAHQKMLLDERWLSALLSQRNPPQGQEAEIIQTSDTKQEMGASPVYPYSADPEPGADPVPCSKLLPSLTSVPPVKENMSSAVSAVPQSLEAETTDPPSPTVEMGSTQESGSVPSTIPAIGARSQHRGDKARGRHKRLVGIVLTLVILAITGAGAILLLQIISTQTHSYPEYLSGNGRLSFFDPLSQESGSKWSSQSNNSGGTCRFTHGAYHVSQQLTTSLVSCPAHEIFSNFAFEVQLTITRGGCGGVVFRDDNAGHFYYFRICEDGIYAVLKYVDPIHAKYLYSGRSSAIHTGQSQQNKIAVVANGSLMTFYVNSQQIDQEQDSSYTSGKVVLVADPSYGNATDVAYSNAGLWRL